MVEEQAKSFDKRVKSRDFSQQRKREVETLQEAAKAEFHDYESWTWPFTQACQTLVGALVRVRLAKLCRSVGGEFEPINCMPDRPFGCSMLTRLNLPFGKLIWWPSALTQNNPSNDSSDFRARLRT
jgi:hypothetical protein